MAIVSSSDNSTSNSTLNTMNFVTTTFTSDVLDAIQNYGKENGHSQVMIKLLTLPEVKGGCIYHNTRYGLLLGSIIHMSQPLVIATNACNTEFQQMCCEDIAQHGLSVVQDEYIAYEGQLIKFGLSIPHIETLTNYMKTNNTKSVVIKIDTSSLVTGLIGDGTFSSNVHQPNTVYHQANSIASVAAPICSLCDEFVCTDPSNSTNFTKGDSLFITSPEPQSFKSVSTLKLENGKTQYAERVRTALYFKQQNGLNSRLGATKNVQGIRPSKFTHIHQVNTDIRQVEIHSTPSDQLPIEAFTLEAFNI